MSTTETADAPMKLVRGIGVCPHNPEDHPKIREYALTSALDLK
jgi:hypothetical protein